MGRGRPVVWWRARPPKHMQSKTYMRLRALDLELWGRCTAGLAGDLERLRRRVAPKGQS